MTQFARWFRKNRLWFDQRVHWTQEQWFDFAKVIVPPARELSLSWQVLEPYSPDWDFDEQGVHQYAADECVSLPTGYSPDTIRDHWDFLSVNKIINDFPERDDAKISTRERSRYLILRLDLLKGLADLIEEAIAKIRYARSVYENAYERIRPGGKQSRRRFDQYDTHLKVWDLRQQGKTLSAIARDMFPKQEITKSLLQTVSDHYKRAQDLIQGGYQDLK